MFQQPSRAQNAANGGMTSQPTRHLAGAPPTATIVAGFNSTLYTSRFFFISPSPSPFSPTTYHSGQAWHQAAPITKDRAQSECVAQQALHSHNKIDTKQAGSSSLQLGGGSPPAATTPAAAWDTLQPNSAISRLELGNPRMHRAAHDLSLGAEYEQTEPGLNPLPANPKKTNSIDRKKPQSVTQAPEAPQLLYWTTAQQTPHFLNKHGNKQASSSGRQLGGESTPAAATHATAWSTLQPSATTPRLEPETPCLCSNARNLPFGTRHEQAEPGLSPLPITSKKINSDERKKLQAATKIPEARQFYNGHRTNAPNQLLSLAGNVLHPLGKSSEQAGRNGLQRGEGTTPAAALARMILQPASTAWAHGVPHMLRPAHDPTLETRHEQAQPLMDILAANTKQTNLEAGNKLQEITKAPEARHPPKGLEAQTSAQIHYLDEDSPLPPPSVDYCEPSEPELSSKIPAEGARRHAQQTNTIQQKGASLICAMSGSQPGNREAGQAQPTATLATEPTLAKGCQDGAAPFSTPVNAPLDLQPPVPPVAHSLDDTVMFRSLRPSQTFVQDFTGRTHVVLFKSTDSIATNLLRYSDKLLLPPLEEIYIRAGCRILRTEGTQLENNLSPDSLLSIMLRCRGGMQDGKKLRGRDRGGTRVPEVSSRTMGGGQTSLDINRPSPVRLEKGRGRGFRAEGRRTTVLHTQPQDDMDGFSRQARIEARQAASIASTAKLCQEYYSTNMDFGPPPEPASSPNEAPMAPEDQPKAIPPTNQDTPDYHHTVEDHRHVTWYEPLTEAGLEHGADTTSALQLDPPDLPNLVCSALQEAPNLPEPNTKAVSFSEETHRDNQGGPESTTSDIVSNASDAVQSATEAHTSIRRQWQAARSNSSSNSSTACFGFDTPVLTESQGFAHREMFYQAEKGESVAQFPPSGNIMDLTGALTTPIKTLCCFDTQKGDNDMVIMGICTITPRHHILTEEGGMTARQAAARGQGLVITSLIERVYNFCLVGGGNTIINTSRQPGETTLTTAATMGYLFTPTSDSQQIGSLTYPEDIRTQLGLRQDLRSGHTRFSPGDVETLLNGELIFKNTTGDIPPKKKKRPGTGPKLLQTQQVPSHSTAEPQPDLETAQECGLTPHFTSDTHILILVDGVARWTPIRQAKRGCTVMQTLPSGNIGELRGAQTAILEHVLFFKDGGEDSDMIRIGMACIAANHPIRTDDGWTLASQAAPQDHGQLPDREFSQLCCLKLHFGGNVLIKTSAPQDQVPTFIEAATMGYHFSPPSGPHTGSPPTYNFRRTGPRDEGRNLTGLLLPGHHTLPSRNIDEANPATHTP